MQARAIELLEDSFPHGTPEGFSRGCKTNHCPAVLSCRTVAQRYRGEFTFRRLIDSGMTVAEIVAAELAEADRAEQVQREAELARRAAVDQERREARAAEVAERRAARARERAAVRDEAKAARAAERADARLSERADAHRERIVHLRAEVTAARRALAAAERRLAAAEGVAVETVVKRAEKHTGRRADTSHDDEVRRLHGEGLIDREIGERIGISDWRVLQVRRRLGLDALRPEQRATKPVRRERAPREVKGHGTLACYARGCRCEECVEANRAYHREYMARRRANGGAGLRSGAMVHGTAVGYQLGCHDREACPASPTCADASLAEERRRRRAAGAEARPMVDAGPVRAHVLALQDAGMNTRAIAAAAGVGHTAVGNLAYGKRGRPMVQVVESTAVAILAVPVPEPKVGAGEEGMK